MIIIVRINCQRMEIRDCEYKSCQKQDLKSKFKSLNELRHSIEIFTSYFLNQSLVYVNFIFILDKIGDWTSTKTTTTTSSLTGESGLM